MNKKHTITILNVCYLSNNYCAGVNINIPIISIKLNKYVNSGVLNYGEKKIKLLEDYDNYFYSKKYIKNQLDVLPTPFNNPDLIVFQGFYHINDVFLAKEAIRKKIPYTIVPRGSLTSSAQEIKPIKKSIGNSLFFNNFVKKASFIHYLTTNEKNESEKKFGIKKYVEVGNGINIPRERYEIKKREEIKIAFIGRYQIYHKGLDLMLEAIKREQAFLRKKHVHFCLYGKNENGSKNILLDNVEQNDLGDIVTINDAVFGEEKKKVLLDSDIFIHTSRFEGHPTSIIEAMGYGVPIIASFGTNMKKEIADNKLGWVCEGDSDSISEVIKTAINDKEEFAYISENCRRYAEECFDWNIVAKETVEKYLDALRMLEDKNEK